MDASGTTASSGASLWTWGGFGDDDDTPQYGSAAAAFDDDDDDAPKTKVATKDCLIFLIDATKTMFDDFEEDATYFQRCIKTAYTVLMNKILIADKDLVGVVFYGTEKTKNESEFKHIYMLQELDTPSAKRIMDLEKIMDDPDATSAELGHSDDFSFNDALWVCSNMFSSLGQKAGQKRIMIFTNNDAPHSNDANALRLAQTKAGDLKELGVDIDLLHMSKAGQLFDVSKFFSSILNVEVAPGESSSGFDDLLERARAKTHSKRSMMTIPFKIADGMEIGVKVYSLIAESKKGQHVWFDSKKNEEVQTKTRYYCHETTQALLPADIKSWTLYGGERVIFEKEEVAAIKKFADPGMVLMGFKPRSKLKKQYNIKNSHFIYPDETIIAGSTTLFAALLDRMILRDVIAIARLIPRMNAEPRFVALLPQREIVDKHQRQITPPGFHIIYLPYADDMRKLKYPPVPKANDDQIETMRKIVDKLLFKTYTSDAFENPALQKHYRVLEDLAFDRDVHEDDFTDFIEPDTDTMVKKVGKYTARFQEQTYPEDYDPDVVASGKRKKAATAGGAGKKPKKEVSLDQIDFKKECEEGRLNKLTLPVLRAFCKTVKIPVAGKKADIVGRIEDHFG